MGNQITNGESDVLFLTDQNGDAYVVSRQVIEHARVPDELKSEVREYATADTKGYGNADYILGGILKYWGWSNEMKGWEDADMFDLDRDGKVGSADYAIAKKAWYEQNKQPPVPQVPPLPGGK
jgi:hypothetical protein